MTIKKSTFAVSKSLTDDHESQRAIAELARAVFA